LQGLGDRHVQLGQRGHAGVLEQLAVDEEGGRAGNVVGVRPAYCSRASSAWPAFSSVMQALNCSSLKPLALAISRKIGAIFTPGCQRAWL
jgi:hypothetical protein